MLQQVCADTAWLLLTAPGGPADAVDAGERDLQSCRADHYSLVYPGQCASQTNTPTPTGTALVDTDSGPVTAMGSSWAYL